MCWTNILSCVFSNDCTLLISYYQSWTNEFDRSQNGMVPCMLCPSRWLLNFTHFWLSSPANDLYPHIPYCLFILMLLSQFSITYNQVLQDLSSRYRWNFNRSRNPSIARTSPESELFDVWKRPEQCWSNQWFILSIKLKLKLKWLIFVTCYETKTKSKI